MPGIGGGGGALGAPMLGIGGGGGGGAGGAELGPGESAVGEVTPGLTGEKARVSSAAERGRGGAMVPNSIEASWRALPAPGPSSSSDESSRSEPTTDHSSSSGRTREGLEPVGVVWTGSGALAAGRRWNGFVSCAAGGDTTGGDATGGDVTGAPAPGTVGWPMFLKKGLRVSVVACGELRLEVLLVAAGGDVAVIVGSGGGEASFSMLLGGVDA